MDGLCVGGSRAPFHGLHPGAGTRPGTSHRALFQFLQLLQFAKCCKDALCLSFINHGERKSDVHEDVIADLCFRRVCQAHILPNASKIHLAAAQAEMLFLLHADDFSWHSETHSQPQIETTSRNRLPKKSAIVRWHLTMHCTPPNVGLMISVPNMESPGSRSSIGSPTPPRTRRGARTRANAPRSPATIPGRLPGQKRWKLRTAPHR